MRDALLWQQAKASVAEQGRAGDLTHTWTTFLRMRKSGSGDFRDSVRTQEIPHIPEHALAAAHGRSGEGSRGGNIVRHTASGHAVYGPSIGGRTRKTSMPVDVLRQAAARSKAKAEDRHRQMSEAEREFAEGPNTVRRPYRTLHEEVYGEPLGKARRVKPGPGQGAFDFTPAPAEAPAAAVEAKPAPAPAPEAGKQVGRTRSGRLVHDKHDHPEHADFTPNDHWDAAMLHRAASGRVFDDASDRLAATEEYKRRGRVTHQDIVEHLTDAERAQVVHHNAQETAHITRRSHMPPAPAAKPAAPAPAAEAKPAAPAAPAVPHPPAGYEPIPHTKLGGWRKREGRGYRYWYPEVAAAHGGRASDVQHAVHHHRVHMLHHGKKEGRSDNPPVSAQVVAYDAHKKAADMLAGTAGDARWTDEDARLSSAVASADADEYSAEAVLSGIHDRHRKAISDRLSDKTIRDTQRDPVRVAHAAMLDKVLAARVGRLSGAWNPPDLRAESEAAFALDAATRASERASQSTGAAQGAAAKPRTISVSRRSQGRGDNYEKGQIITRKDGTHWIVTRVYRKWKDDDTDEWMVGGEVEPLDEKRSRALNEKADEKKAKVEAMQSLVADIRRGVVVPETDVDAHKPKAGEYEAIVVRPSTAGTGGEAIYVLNDGRTMLWHGGSYDDYRQSLVISNDAGVAQRARAMLAAKGEKMAKKSQSATGRIGSCTYYSPEADAPTDARMAADVVAGRTVPGALAAMAKSWPLQGRPAQTQRLAEEVTQAHEDQAGHWGAGGLKEWWKDTYVGQANVAVPLWLQQEGLPREQPVPVEAQRPRTSAEETLDRIYRAADPRCAVGLRLAAVERPGVKIVAG
jgi:hypothetical protein